MIGKLLKGSGARGLLDYLLASRDNNGEVRPRADLIGGTFTGRNARSIAAEFGRLHALRPRLGPHVAHMSLSLPEGERQVTDDEWSAIAAHWAKGMGFDGYAVVCHGDHIHIAASRVRLDGSVVSDSHDWRRSESLIREIEERWNLQRVESSHLLEPERAATHRLAPTHGRIALAERGVASPAEQIADVIDASLSGRRVTATEFVAALEAAGVAVRPNVATTGRLNGFAYELDGVTVTAKALGHGYKLQNLERRGLEYVQDRDFAALNAARERAARGSAPRAVDRADITARGGSGTDARAGRHPGAGG